MLPKRYTHLNKPATFSCRFVKVCMSFCYHPAWKGQKLYQYDIECLAVFLVVFLSESINGPYLMVGILLCSYFGLDHTSRFEIIHTRIDDRQLEWYCFYVRSQILKHITRTKIFSIFQSISKLSAVKSCACLLELPGLKFEGSAVRISGTAWIAMCETRWRIVLFWLWYFLFWSNKVIMA